MTRDFIRTYGQRQIAGVNLVGAPALLGGKAMPFIWAGFLEHAPGACARPGDEHCGDALVVRALFAKPMPRPIAARREVR
jgi:hypothetical protein